MNENTMDTMMGVIVTNLYTVSKEDQVIRLRDLDDSEHFTEYQMIAIEAARIVNTIMGYKIEMELGFWKYLKFIKNNWVDRKKFKRMKKNAQGGIDYKKLLVDVSNAYKQPYTIWAEIFEKFYDRSKYKNE